MTFQNCAFHLQTILLEKLKGYLLVAIWRENEKSGHLFLGKLKRFLSIGIWRENLAYSSGKLKGFFTDAIWQENAWGHLFRGNWKDFWVLWFDEKIWPSAYCFFRQIEFQFQFQFQINAFNYWKHFCALGFDEKNRTRRKDSLKAITQPCQIRHCLRKFAVLKNFQYIGNSQKNLISIDFEVQFTTKVAFFARVRI